MGRNTKKTVQVAFDDLNPEPLYHGLEMPYSIISDYVAIEYNEDPFDEAYAEYRVKRKTEADAMYIEPTPRITRLQELVRPFRSTCKEED